MTIAPENQSNFFNHLTRKIMLDDCPGLAAEMAFHVILSMPPALIVLVYLFKTFDPNSHLLSALLHFTQRFAPYQTSQLVQTLFEALQQENSGHMALVSLGVMLWTGTTGVTVMLKALSRAYGHQEFHAERFFYNRFWSFILIITVGFTFFITSNFLIFLNAFMEVIYITYNLNDSLLRGINLFHQVVPILGIFCFSTFLYAAIPYVYGIAVRMVHIIPGAGIFAVLWILISYLFSSYVQHYAIYHQIYGSLGTVAVLMIWFYLSSLIFLIGGEINASLHERSHRLKIKNTQSA